MKEFTVALEGVYHDLTDADYPHEFKINLGPNSSRVLHFRGPEPGEGVLLIAALAVHGAPMERFATYLDLFSRVLRPDDRQWWNQAILDRRNPLSRKAPELLAGGEDGEGGILRFVVQEWGANPTREPDGSSSTPPQPGSGSTQTTPGSTYFGNPSGSY